MALKLTSTCIVFATLALLTVPAAAQTKFTPSAKPDESLLFSVAPATPQECYRFGMRYWTKKMLFDKSGTCKCIKCGWHSFHRICWKTC